jgi:hypothetical protein
MDHDVNPYASPKAPFEFIPSSEPRRVPYGMMAFTGMAVGAASFLASMAMIPRDVPSLSEHDLRLANHLGFIYPPAVGIWAAWIRRSFAWGLFGIVSGFAVGGAYYALCGYNFLAVMVGFPCLLGGCTSVLLGTRHDSWIDGIPQRFFKGLLAGLVLGLVYAVLLNIVGAFMLPSFRPSVAEYSAMMWWAGTVAMTVASALYFLLFHWSAGLHPRNTDTNEPPDGPERPVVEVLDNG